MDDQGQNPPHHHGVTPHQSNIPAAPAGLEVIRPTDPIFQDIQPRNAQPAPDPVPPSRGPAQRPVYYPPRRRMETPPARPVYPQPQPAASPPPAAPVYPEPAPAPSPPEPAVYPQPQPQPQPATPAPTHPVHPQPEHPHAAHHAAPVPQPAHERALHAHGVKPKKGRRKYAILVCALVIVALGAAGFLQFFNNGNSALSAYTVSQGSMTFTVNFYKGAKVEQKNSLTYLVDSNAQGNQTTFTVAPVGVTAACTVYGELPFSYQLSGQSTSGCYKANKQAYESNVQAQANGDLYQIRLASQNQVSLKDAEDIFSSVDIQ